MFVLASALTPRPVYPEYPDVGSLVGLLAGAGRWDQVDLDDLTDELLTVVDQTMQPTRASLWVRSQAPSNAIGPSA